MAISPASCTRHTEVLPLSTHLTCSSISPSSKGWCCVGCFLWVNVVWGIGSCGILSSTLLIHLSFIKRFGVMVGCWMVWCWGIQKCGVYDLFVFIGPTHPFLLHQKGCGGDFGDNRWFVCGLWCLLALIISFVLHFHLIMMVFTRTYLGICHAT